MTARTWSSVAELEHDTAVYQRSWWRGDPAVRDAADADPELARLLASGPALLRTDDVYGPAGWSARARLHDRLVAGQLGSGPPPPRPEAYFTIGCMGSGKTTVLRPLVDAYRAVVLGRAPSTLARVAADEVRMALPEYQDGLGSEVVATEAFYVTYSKVFPAARDSGLDVVFDTIGRTMPPAREVSFRPSLDELRAAGYSVHVMLVETPFDQCVDRARRRALTEDGRLVPLAAQQDVYDQPAQCLASLLADGVVDEWARIEGSGSAAAPPMIAASDGWASRYPDLLAHNAAVGVSVP